MTQQTDPKPTTIQCPECNGTGKIQVPQSEFNEAKTIECPMCEGYGYWTEGEGEEE